VVVKKEQNDKHAYNTELMLGLPVRTVLYLIRVHGRVFLLFLVCGLILVCRQGVVPMLQAVRERDARWNATYVR
jgi:hypothetical protein